jgi:hypothetical protein
MARLRVIGDESGNIVAYVLDPSEIHLAAASTKCKPESAAFGHVLHVQGSLAAARSILLG